MATQRLGIIMHGITGRMGYNQHLVRSICAIRDQGGVVLPNGDRVMPDPILVGRNADKIAEIGKKHGIARRPRRPRRGARQQGRHAVLRRRLDADAGRPPHPGDRGRQARLLRKADRRRSSRSALEVAQLRQGARASSTASCRTSSSCPACASSRCCAIPASSAASSRCAASSATGCSRATGRPRSGRAGTTARPMAAASSSICSATGATCSTTCSARSRR